MWSLWRKKDGHFWHIPKQGKVFATTGEVLIPSFTVDKKQVGDEVNLLSDGRANISFLAK